MSINLIPFCASCPAISFDSRQAAIEHCDRLHHTLLEDVDSSTASNKTSPTKSEGQKHVSDDSEQSSDHQTEMTATTASSSPTTTTIPTCLECPSRVFKTRRAVEQHCATRGHHFAPDVDKSDQESGKSSSDSEKKESPTAYTGAAAGTTGQTQGSAANEHTEDKTGSQSDDKGENGQKKKRRPFRYNRNRNRRGKAQQGDGQAQAQVEGQEHKQNDDHYQGNGSEFQSAQQESNQGQQTSHDAGSQQQDSNNQQQGFNNQHTQGTQEYSVSHPAAELIQNPKQPKPSTKIADISPRQYRCPACPNRHFDNIYAIGDHFHDTGHNPTCAAVDPEDPINAFFAEYPEYPYNPHYSYLKQFGLMRKHFGWGIDSQEHLQAREELHKAMIAAFNRDFGVDKDDKLATWKKLVEAIGTPTGEIPETIEECQNLMHRTHVNLVDLHECYRIGQHPRVFRNAYGLADYTSRTFRTFPNIDPDVHEVLSHLMRRVGDTQRRRNGFNRGGRNNNRNGNRKNGNGGQQDGAKQEVQAADVHIKGKDITVDFQPAENKENAKSEVAAN